MRPLSSVFMLIGVCLAVAAVARPAPESAVDPGKELIFDGSFVHDVGRLHLHITNWGLVGSQYTNAAPWSDAPSGRWPGEGGVDHLWSAGLWVGGVRLGVPSVATGQYETELRASDDPADIIYETSWDAPASSRYPFPLPDDDGDGAEDEDPFNGVDDDGDGLVDEDMAGIGDQHFRCVMTDTRVGDAWPDHEPLSVEVVQESFQWTDDAVADFVGFSFTVRNLGDVPIEQLYLGMFSDFDIDDPAGGGAAEAIDDMVGFAVETVEAYPGEWVDVEVAYMYEAAGVGQSGYMGWLPVGHPTDPDGAVAPPSVGVRSFQRFRGNLPFSQGGDPVNDQQRYEAMSWDAHDGDSPAPDDHRLLISVGPFAELPAGGTIVAAFALVAGDDLQAMLANAARARLVYEGLAFDRDGDPANGAEFVVRWLGPEEIALPVEGGGEAGEAPAPDDVALDVAPNPFNPRLAVEARLTDDGPVRVVVTDVKGRTLRVLHDGVAAAGARVWTWDGRDQAGRRAASGVYLVRLETAQRLLQRRVTLVK